MYPPAGHTVAAPPPNRIFPLAFAFWYASFSGKPLPNVAADPMFFPPIMNASV
jgi:hypothetical protein